MTDLETMPVERVDVDTAEITETGKPTVAHIVKTKRGENAAAVVLEARVMGTPVEALCGHVWVPSRDPKQLPVCEECKSIYEMYRAFNDGLHETPQD
jgi:tRNA(Ile2) C34 agmatinyltransferase TiaS